MHVSYVQRVLQPNEQVLYTSQLHWLIYAPAFLLLALAAVAAVAVSVLVEHPNYRYVALGICASLDANKAGRQLLKEHQDVTPLQLSADDDLSPRIDPVDLKD